MGNSTGSMLYMFGAIILMSLVGVGLYQFFIWIRKKWKDRKR